MTEPSGFRAQTEDHVGTDERCEHPFYLNLTHTDVVTLEHINQVVAELIEGAR